MFLQLNILPISSGVKSIQKLQGQADKELDEKGDAFVSASDLELKELQLSLKKTQPVGALAAACRTLDQAKAVLTFVEAIRSAFVVGCVDV